MVHNMPMSFIARTSAPIIKSAGNSYIDQDQLQKEMGYLNPLEVAALAKKHNIPASYLQGDVPYYFWMSRDNARKYSAFLNDLYKLKWVKGDSIRMDAPLVTKKDAQDYIRRTLDPKWRERQVKRRLHEARGGSTRAEYEAGLKSQYPDITPSQLKAMGDYYEKTHPALDANYTEEQARQWVEKEYPMLTEDQVAARAKEWMDERNAPWLHEENGKTQSYMDIPLLRDDNGRVLPAHKQYIALLQQRAMLRGRQWTVKDVVDNQLIIGRSLGTPEDVGVVSRDFDASKFVPVYEREAEEAIQQRIAEDPEIAKLPKEQLDAARAAIAASLRDEDQIREKALDKAIRTYEKANPELMRAASEELTRHRTGGSFLDHVSAAAAGVQSGALDANITQAFLSKLGIKDKDILEGNGFWKGLANNTLGAGSNIVDSVLRTNRTRDTNYALGGNSWSSKGDKDTEALQMAMHGNTGDVYHSSFASPVVNTAMGALNLSGTSSIGKLGLSLLGVGAKSSAKAGASWLARHLPLGDTTKAIALGAGLEAAGRGADYLENSDARKYMLEGAPATDSNGNVIVDDEGKPVAGIRARALEAGKREASGKSLRPRELADVHTFRRAVNDQAPMSYAQETPKQETAPKPSGNKDGGGTEWYKNPWVWGAGGAALLGGGLLLHHYMKSRGKRPAARPAGKVQPPRVANRPAQGYGQRPVPYDYAPQRPPQTTYNSYDDPFAFYTGDYYY